MVLTVEPPPPNPPAGGSQLEALPHTKSPSSQGVIKWARITSPGPEAQADAPFLASATLPLQTPRQPDSRPPNDLPSTPPSPTASYDVVANQLKHLESLVDSVLATVVIIQAASSQPITLSTHMQEALELLNKLVVPATSARSCTTTHPVPQSKPGQPTMPSHAQVTKGHTTHTAKPSPAGHPPLHNHAHP